MGLHQFKGGSYSDSSVKPPYLSSGSFWLFNCTVSKGHNSELLSVTLLHQGLRYFPASPTAGSLQAWYFIEVPKVGQVELSSVEEVVGNSFKPSYIMFFLK